MDRADTESTHCDNHTDTIASDARVAAFDVGNLRCGGAATAPVDVTWATEGATGVAIAVDNVTPVRLGASGTRAMLVPCDDNPHGISITALADSGPGETETKEIAD